jgi:5-bromo-4-chloroindolyl phosphate hydrolysis protein
MKKLRDLFIGIVLNLACNIEDQGMIAYLVAEIDILAPLTMILADSRNDWPTHGASQAIMQYSHLAM